MMDLHQPLYYVCCALLGPAGTFNEAMAFPLDDCIMLGFNKKANNFRNVPKSSINSLALNMILGITS